MNLRNGVEHKIFPKQEIIGDVSINANLEQGPFFIDNCDTVPKLFLRRCRELGKKTAHREKKYGKWESFTWSYYLERVFEISAALQTLGFEKGDRIAVLSECRKEWLYADLACQCLGGFCTGVYTTDSAEQLRYQLIDSGSRILFVDSDEQLDKFLSIKNFLPKLQNIIVFDRKNLVDFEQKNILFLEDLYEMGREVLEHERPVLEKKIENGLPEDLAILVYTSGTTGNPKGVMLTQSNLIYAQSAAKHVLPFVPGDELFCFLPLCHIYERTTSVLSPIVNKTIVNFVENPDTIFENLQEISPTFLAGVPRIYEKIFSNVNLMVSDATTIGKYAYNRALKVGKRRFKFGKKKKSIPFLLTLEWHIWKLLVHQNILRILGLAKVKRAVSGAAPISEELLEWFNALGFPLFEGYGMSETVAAMSVNLPDSNRIGTVGRPIPGSSARISDNGEIEYKAPSVFLGYYNDSKKTNSAFTSDGWFKTGDIGEISDGYIKITGRIKDILITSGGKNISPAYLENSLKFSPFISDAVLLGDGKKYITALIIPDQENIEKFAQENEVEYFDFASLCQNQHIRTLMENVVSSVNQRASKVEQIKDFRILDLVLTAEDEELTATMKIKRSIVEKKHARLIKEMYD